MKKKLAIIMAILMLLTMVGIIGFNHVLASSYGVQSFLPGDANNDGVVDTGDAIQTMQGILGFRPLTSGMDANQNGVIDMGDVICIINITLSRRAITGDVNGDGQVNQADITYEGWIIRGLVPPTLGADVNGDGKIDLNDIWAIQRIMSGSRPMGVAWGN